MFGEIKYFNLNKLNKTFISFTIPLILLLLFKGSLSFTGLYDDYYVSAYGPEIFSMIEDERTNIFNKDVIRAIIIGIVLFITLRLYKSIGRNFTFIC